MSDDPCTAVATPLDDEDVKLGMTGICAEVSVMVEKSIARGHNPACAFNAAMTIAVAAIARAVAVESSIAGETEHAVKSDAEALMRHYMAVEFENPDSIKRAAQRVTASRNQPGAGRVH